MGNNQHEDERYKKFYDRPPHGEVPKDPRIKEAKEGGAEPVAAGSGPPPENDPARP